ncbi:PREDICTED: receptor homology region, transmembrane domain- and RING domain-containing protein 1 [Tarenaya hassleriana]|uniref:receptor homology region, transmembrane domain- and RING domain-containing protein 1 n=1 Tax=Tarenaya hassleriana TaxID=28532 RepID=UPI00053C8C51|nr:PREDICTED: receptor homology region, transmembrane domain- and RING domain-containing protein 1 [Tarenaya hassleriana]
MRRPLAATFLCFLLPFSAATVVLTPISASFSDLPAKYAGSVNKHGICGSLYVADPIDGCSPLRHGAASNWTEQRTKFALIIRGKCSFEEKLLNAQISGYQAVIVYDNTQNDDLVYIKVNHEGLTVHAVFVSNMAGEILRENAKGQDGECCIYPPSEGRAWTVLAISFLSLILIMTFLLIAFFAPRRWTQWRGRSSWPNSVDVKLVETLPCFTYRDFSQNHAGETCAICLEDYRLGENLRLLPCQHSFHLSCVDSWLTKWGTSCPVCKLDIRTHTASSKVNGRDWLRE